MTLKDLVKYVESLSASDPSFDPRLIEQWLHSNIPANRIGHLVQDLVLAAQSAGSQIPDHTPISAEEMKEYELGERVLYYLSVISEYKEWKRSVQSPSGASSQSCSSGSSTTSPSIPSPSLTHQSSTGSTPCSPSTDVPTEPDPAPSSQLPAPTEVKIPELPTPAVTQAYSHATTYVMQTLWKLRRAQGLRDTAAPPLSWLDKFQESELSTSLAIDVTYAALSILDIDNTTFDFVSDSLPTAPERTRALLDLNQVLALLVLPRRQVPPLPGVPGPSEADIDFDITWIRALTILDMSITELSKIQSSHAALTHLLVGPVQLRTAHTFILGLLKDIRSSIAKHYRSSQ